jgi:hypothetical protein
MSAIRFQTELSLLVVDPARRDRIRNEPAPWTDGGLTELERQRLAAVARAPGLEITGTLHKAFRLGKLLSMLPFTCALMKDDLLAAETAAFWESHPPRTFYYRNEAVAFCDYLRGRLREDLACPYLDEIVAYEKAALDLRHAPEGAAEVIEIPFRHDPEVLFSRLGSGERPADVPARTCVLRGTREAAGGVSWTVVEAA